MFGHGTAADSNPFSQQSWALIEAGAGWLSGLMATMALAQMVSFDLPMSAPSCTTPCALNSLAGTRFAGVVGVALLSSFGDGSTGKSDSANEVAPVFVFPSSVSTQAVWEAVSHELGHALGLS